MLLALLVIWSDYASYNASSADSATKMSIHTVGNNDFPMQSLGIWQYHRTTPDLPDSLPVHGSEQISDES